MFCLPVPTLIYLLEIYIYFKDRSANSAARKYVDGSWEYINRSWTHECGNWDWGRAIPRKEIHKWDFPCSASIHSRKDAVDYFSAIDRKKIERPCLLWPLYNVYVYLSPLSLLQQQNRGRDPLAFRVYLLYHSHAKKRKKTYIEGGGLYQDELRILNLALLQLSRIGRRQTCNFSKFETFHDLDKRECNVRIRIIYFSYFFFKGSSNSPRPSFLRLLLDSRFITDFCMDPSHPFLRRLQDLSSHSRPQ